VEKLEKEGEKEEKALEVKDSNSRWKNKFIKLWVEGEERDKKKEEEQKR